MSIFIDPEGSFLCTNSTFGETFSIIPENGFGVCQLLFLTFVYGAILYHASNLIAEGSDLLMLVLNPGLVGGLLLPVMGAIPDGAIILVSGLGPRERAAKQLQVGVGTLAGSTIMLLTLPWFLATFYGRVNLNADNTEAIYRTNKDRPKLTRPHNIFRTGVTPTNEIPRNALIMLGSGFIYLIIQGPAFRYMGEAGGEKIIAQDESMWALMGFMCSVVAFVVYNCYQLTSANAQEAQKEKILTYRAIAFKKRIVDLAFLLEEEEELKKATDGLTPRSESQVDRILRHTFDKYDEDGNGYLDRAEVKTMLSSLNVSLDTRDINELLGQMDSDNNGSICFDEYKAATIRWLMEMDDNDKNINEIQISSPSSVVCESLNRQLSKQATKYGGCTVREDLPDFLDDYDADDVDDENSSLTSRQVYTKSAYKLLLGVSLVTIFSDPMCSVLSELGNRISIPPYYVSFFITPLSSNASELITAIYFGKKRTKASITLSYSALLGAATMNNTFCLSIFMGIVYFRGFEWDFSAEVMAILLVELIVCLLACKRTFSTATGFVVLSLYPLSIVLVAFLNYYGWK